MLSSKDPYFIDPTKVFDKLLLKGQLSTRYFDEKGHFDPTELSKDLRKHFSIITLRDTDEIFVYNSKTGLYEGGGKKKGYNILREKISLILGDSYSEPNAKATINDITARTQINRKDFDVPIQFIPVENGVLDISKNPIELLHRDKKYYFTYQLPILYNPKAECSNFLKFLSELLPEEKFRLQIQEMFGWCLWRNYNYQVAFMLIGEGSNGKSTLLAVLRCLLSRQNVVAISLQEICADKFSTSDLYQKFANIAAETPSKKIEESDIFKSLTDGVTLIRAQKKYGQPFYFVNYAKLIFSANKVPQSKDRGYAYYRRWMLIFFNVRFGNGDLPKEDNIIEKITTPEEMSGILKWAIEGLQRLKKQGKFSERMSVEETGKYYERLSNPVATFLTEYIEETDNEDDFISKDYLWKDLLHYCEKNNLPKPKSKKQLAQEINTHFENVESKQRKVGKKEKAHVWVNCKFSDGIAKLDYVNWVEEQ